MKQSHLITTVGLVALIVIAWLCTVLGLGDVQNEQYQQHLSLAQDYSDRGLFWKSAKEYQQALNISDSEEVWTSMLEAYRSSLKQGDGSYDEYLGAAVNAVATYQQNEEFLMQLVSLYMESDDFINASKVLGNAIEAGLTSEAVEKAYIDATYATELLWGRYGDYFPCVNGFYRVKKDDRWMYLDGAGVDTSFGNAEYLSPVGADGIRVHSNGGETVLLNEENVPQGNLKGTPEAIGTYLEGKVPLKLNGSYAYYDLLGDKLFGDYQQAGSFENGLAAVQAGSEWYLINEKGERDSEASYQQIVLALDGTWLENGVMLAKKDGRYALYNQEGEQISDFTCDAVDVVTADGLIAFCSGGLWGFVDTAGTVVIEPAYKQAKSFSNGLAAVFDGTAWGFINKEGKLAIAYSFEDADYFSDQGTCMVRVEEEWALLERAVKKG